jgi:hypothetical protein
MVNLIKDERGRVRGEEDHGTSEQISELKRKALVTSSNGEVSVIRTINLVPGFLT